MITEIDILIRILISAVLGALIGYEREIQSQPAGLRTHIILIVGSCLAMTISILISIQFQPFAPNGDPARLAAQVISGIGFLCAGAILRYGTNVKGLTTATSLWTTAIIGLAIGAGHFFSGIATTIVSLVVLVLLNKFEKRYINGYTTFNVKMQAVDHSGMLQAIEKELYDHGHKIISMHIVKDLEQNQLILNTVIKTKADHDIESLINMLTFLPGMKYLEIE